MPPKKENKPATTSSGRRKQTGSPASAGKVKTAAERRTTAKPRRKSKPKADKELYKLPKSDIKEFIATERRHDELDRVREVQEQKRVWRNTMAICTFAILALISLAIWGMYN